MFVCVCAPLMQCCVSPFRQLSSVGRWCWSPSRWALNHPCFLANSQHKYPRRNTEVTLGSTIFQSSVYTSPAPQITSSLTAFLLPHILPVTSRSPVLLLLSLLACIFAVCLSVFLIFLLSPLNLSEPLTPSVWAHLLLYLFLLLTLRPLLL